MIHIHTGVTITLTCDEPGCEATLSMGEVNGTMYQTGLHVNTEQLDVVRKVAVVDYAWSCEDERDYCPCHP